MVEEVTVNPGSVRCLGNIVSPKTLSDYNKYFSKITTGTDSIDGDTRTVYTSEYLTGSNLFLTVDRAISTSASNFTVTVLLKDQSGNAIASADLYCIVNGKDTYTETTDNSGVATFTIPIDDNTTYKVRVYYPDTTTIAGCSQSTSLIIADVESLTLESSLGEYIGDGEKDYLVATLTGTNLAGETIGVPYQEISIYEEFTPQFNITSTPNPFLKGQSTSLTVQLVDSDDGSIVPGESVDVYIDMDWTPTVKRVNLQSSNSTLKKGNNYSTVLTAVVYDQKGFTMSGESVVFKKGTTTLGTVTTDSNGKATYSYTHSSYDDVTLSANVSSVSDSVSLEWEPAPTTMILTNTEDLLSAVDEDSTVLTATVYDQTESVMAGETVVFRKGTTVLDSVTTDSNGVATFEYESCGAGDVTITAKCARVSESVTIEDCVIFVASKEYVSASSDVTCTYDSDLSFSLPTNCEITFEMKSNIQGSRFQLYSITSSTCDPAAYNIGGHAGLSSGEGIIVPFKLDGDGTFTRLTTASANDGVISFHSFKFTKTGTSIKTVFDGDHQDTTTIGWIDDFNDYTLCGRTWNTGTMEVKNIKIKQINEEE